MATVTTDVINVVAQYLEALKQHQQIDAAYLYGSHIKGTANQWSDIDLAIVSPDFSADLFHEQVRLMRLAAQIDDRIEPRPFTPEAFNINQPLVYEILQSGLKIL